MAENCHPPLTGVLWLNVSEIVACGEKSVIVSSTYSIHGHWKYGGGGGGGGAQPFLTFFVTLNVKRTAVCPGPSFLLIGHALSASACTMYVH